MTLATLTIGAGLGGLAFWNTKTTLRVRVQAAAEQAGIERFVPLQPSPTAVLRESMLDTAKRLCGHVRRHPFMVRRLADTHAFEVRQVHPQKQQNDYHFCFSATITDRWELDLLRVGDVIPSAFAIHDDLQQTAKHRRDYLAAPVVSDVMVQALQSWRATRLKDDGGVWFLPGEHIGRYRAFANAIYAGDDGPRFCCTTFEIGSDPDTVAHVLDSLRAEVTAGIEGIMQDVLDAEEGMQERSIRLRMGRADAYLRKVAVYEKLTGETLADLSGAVEQAKQALAINRLLSVAV
jgi:hypothetical protein